MPNIFLDSEGERDALTVSTTTADARTLKRICADSELSQGEVLRVYMRLHDLAARQIAQAIGSGSYPSENYLKLPPLFHAAVRICVGLGLLDTAEMQTVLAAAAGIAHTRKATEAMFGILSSVIEARVPRTVIKPSSRAQAYKDTASDGEAGTDESD